MEENTVDHQSTQPGAGLRVAFVTMHTSPLERADRLIGTSLKFQRKVATAVKRARHLALMPYVADLLK